MKMTKKILFATLLTLSATHSYATNNLNASPIYSQEFVFVDQSNKKFDLNGVPTFKCRTCQNAYFTGDWRAFLNYVVPVSAAEQGTMKIYYDLLNESGYRLCEYNVQLSFNIDTSGNFKMIDGAFPATLTGDYSPVCKYAAVPVTTVSNSADTITLSFK